MGLHKFGSFIFLSGVFLAAIQAQQPTMQQHGTTNQAAATNNGAMSQGPCNVNVVNPTSSVIQIVGCKFDGLTAQEQADQIKQLLGRARQNGVALSRIQAALDKLISEAKPSVVQQTVEEGVINSGNISAPLTFNDNRQYGQPGPPPKAVVQQTILSGLPATRPDGISDSAWLFMQQRAQSESLGEAGLSHNPGVQFLVGADRPFPNPEFLIQCDRPCVGTGAYPYTGPDISVVHSGLGVPSNQFLRTDQAQNITLLQVANPPTLLRGQLLVVKVRSLDAEQIKATIQSYAEPTSR